MPFRVLADLTVVLHLAFIVFVVCGGLLALRWRRLPWIHLPAAAYGVALEIQGWICPLTPLENSLRRQAGDTGYAGGFIEHYILPIVYPSGLTPEVQLALAAIVVVVNVAAYSLVIRARRLRHPGGTSSSSSAGHSE
jgi:hypothetical protein